MNEDLQYWGIDGDLIDSCCFLKHYSELKYSQTEAKRDQKCREKEVLTALEENFGNTKFGKCRKFLWCLTKYPERGKSAKVGHRANLFEFLM